MTYTSPSRGIDKKCKECEKPPSETEFGKHRYTLKHGGFSYHEKSTCKACEAKIAREYMAKNKDKRVKAKKKHRDKYYGTIRYHVQEKIATWRKASNVLSDLTVEYLIELYNKQDGYCFYSGEKMIFGWVDGKVHHNSLSLDKLDPSKGYVQGNVVWCTYLINTMKQNMTEENFYQVMNTVFQKTFGVSMGNNTINILKSSINNPENKQKILEAVEKAVEECAKQHNYIIVDDSGWSGNDPYQTAQPSQVVITVDIKWDPTDEHKDPRIVSTPIIDLKNDIDRVS